MMKTPGSADCLKLDIEAMKIGQYDKVKKLLIDIVKQDKENEQT